MKLSSIMLAAIHFAALAQATNASTPPLLQESVVAALAEQLDGARAKRDVEAISAQHRMRASRGIAAATDYVAGELRKAGFTDAAVLRLPADGARFYGTQKSRPAWDADFAELSTLPPGDQPVVAAAKFVHGPEDDSAFGGSVPEPASLSLLAAALVGIAARRR